MNNPFAPHLVVENREAIRIVTLNRPERFNAIDEGLHRSLELVWRELAHDPDVRAVVLTGAGRAFCAGGDMDMIQGMWNDAGHRRVMLEEGRQIVQEMAEFPLPIVAAVNGPAVGLGCSIALLCDIVYMSDSAYLADPHVAVGLTAGDGGPIVWPLLTSILRAKEFLFTGDRIAAPTAVSFGLANRSVEQDQLLPEALALADRLCSLPPQALRTTKRAINAHLRRAVGAVVDYAFAAEHDSFDTPEHRAIVNSYLARA
jgi:enoyl-CoA hydratase